MLLSDSEHCLGQEGDAAGQIDFARGHYVMISGIGNPRRKYDVRQIHLFLEGLVSAGLLCSGRSGAFSKPGGSLTKQARFKKDRMIGVQKALDFMKLLGTVVNWPSCRDARLIER